MGSGTKKESQNHLTEESKGATHRDPQSHLGGATSALTLRRIPRRRYFTCALFHSLRIPTLGLLRPTLDTSPFYGLPCLACRYFDDTDSVVDRIDR